MRTFKYSVNDSYPNISGKLSYAGSINTANMTAALWANGNQSGPFTGEVNVTVTEADNANMSWLEFNYDVSAVDTSIEGSYSLCLKVTHKYDLENDEIETLGTGVIAKVTDECGASPAPVPCKTPTEGEAASIVGPATRVILSMTPGADDSLSVDGVDPTDFVLTLEGSDYAGFSITMFQSKFQIDFDVTMPTPWPTPLPTITYSNTASRPKFVDGTEMCNFTDLEVQDGETPP